jgi:uncharacterized protein (TIGR00730 family)
MTAPTPVKSVCVFCGAREGASPAFARAADALGAAFAREGVQLVYGGGSTGLMGRVARACRENGGRVVGVIPTFLLPREGASPHIDELIVVETMHERKHTMFDRSDAFVALPGGVGTLDELVEQMVWGQLGRHAKPIVLADVGGFWGPLLTLLGKMSDDGFLHDVRPGAFKVAADVEEVVALATGRPNGAPNENKKGARP